MGIFLRVAEWIGVVNVFPCSATCFKTNIPQEGSIPYSILFGWNLLGCMLLYKTYIMIIKKNTHLEKAIGLLYGPILYVLI